MYKMRNKKGFTLIEMMAVVAIIAVLVSIVIPIFGESTNKANAATNAANLRSVEAVAAQLLVTNPDAFNKAPTSSAVITYLNEEVIPPTEALAAKLPALEAKMKEHEEKSKKNPFYAIVNAIQIGIDTASYAAAYGASESLPTIKSVLESTENRLCHAYYAKDGVITLSDGTTIAAPTAKGLNVGGLNMEKGTEMILVVSDDEISATYSGLNRTTFGIVADGGSNVNLSGAEHSYVDGDDEDNLCDICGQEHSMKDQYEGWLDKEQQGKG